MPPINSLKRRRSIAAISEAIEAQSVVVPLRQQDVMSAVPRGWQDG